LQQLSYVRNRAAHHEPIHRRDLLKDLDSAIELAAWVSPDAAGWIAGTATVKQTVLGKPIGRRNS
jgi:hypothetical protein